MSTAKREREARRKQGRRSEPFAWLRCDQLVSAEVCDLPPATLKLFMLLHANYHGQRERSIVPYSKAVKLARISRASVAAGFRHLRERGLITLLRAPTRPRSAGGARGDAAEWGLPHRATGKQPLVTLPPNQRRPAGKFVWHCERLRIDVLQTSGAALKVLVYAVGHGDRAADGRVTHDSFPLPSGGLAKTLNLSPATTKRAIAELVAQGRLRVVQQGAGRRAATFALADAYARPPRLPPKSQKAIAGHATGQQPSTGGPTKHGTATARV